MAGRVVLYCPDLPPVPGGLPDHTLALARALAGRGADVLVAGQRGEPELFSPLPCRTGVGLGGLAAAAAAAGAASLILQYVPFAFARFGLAPALPLALAAARHRAIRIGVFLHEPYVPFTRLPWLVTGGPMRWQFRAVMRRADVIWSPVPAFLERARRVARPGTTLTAVPVGATVPVRPADRGRARAGLGLASDDVAVGAFCPEPAGGRPDWIAAAGAALRDLPQVRWVLFGARSETAAPSLNGAVPPGDPSRVQRLGRLDPADVSRVFQALDVAVAPFADGLTLRRTSAMAALAHGVPLVSSRGPLFDPALEDAAACADDSEAFAAALRALAGDPARRRELGAAGRRFYETRGSVDVLAARVVGDLGLA